MGNQIGAVPADKLLGALADLNHKLKTGNISFSELTTFLKRKNPFEEQQKRNKVREQKLETVPDINWQMVYDLLGMTSEYKVFYAENSKLFATEAEHWLVPVIVGVTPSKIVDVFKSREVAVQSLYSDIDAGIRKEGLDKMDESHLRKFKRSVNAMEHLNKSANTLQGERVECITLVERLLLGLGYFLATGKHLDAQTITLCAGSRNSDANRNVPNVWWSPFDRMMVIYWDSTDGHADILGTRVAVA